jgi:membrane-bound serine protease (ClpP class)
MEDLTLAYLLLAIGAVLMLAELFLPTGGICFILAALCALAGISLIFVYGDTRTGFIALLVSFVAVPIGLSALFYLWPQSLWGKRLIPLDEDNVTVASMPGNALLEQLKGRMGKTISPMRPSGIVEFDGRRIDCVTEGMMLDINQWVRCVDVKSSRVIVRQIDKPNLEDLESTNFG